MDHTTQTHREETESSSRSKAALSNTANSASLPRSKGPHGWTPFQDSHHMGAGGRASTCAYKGHLGPAWGCRWLSLPEAWNQDRLGQLQPQKAWMPLNLLPFKGRFMGMRLPFGKAIPHSAQGFLLVLFGDTVKHGGSNWGRLHVRWEPSPLHCFSGLQAGDFKCGGKGKNGPKGNWAESRTAD